MHQNSRQLSASSESSKNHSDSSSAVQNATGKGERIAKYLARCGIASRRESEKLVEKGRIAVYFSESRKKEKITHPSTLISKTDQVFMDDMPVDPPALRRLWLYHKPAGLITTHSDPLGRPTIFENLPKELPRVISIGRLDLNSEGLILLTNDGHLSRELELPDRGWKRTYRVRVFGTINPEALKKLKTGIIVEGIQYKSIIATPESPLNSSRNTWLNVQLFEGKNREIRRVMQALGLKVNRLIRLAYGPFMLGDLPTGKVLAVSPEEAHHLLPAYFPAPQTGKTGKDAAKNPVGKRPENTKQQQKKAAPPGGRKSRNRPIETTDKAQKDDFVSAKTKSFPPKKRGHFKR